MDCSVISYPDRGPWGKSSYRGNTSGYVVKDFLEYAHKDKRQLFCDPAEGGGTSGDVACSMGIRYRGLDLRDGFNLLRDDLGSTLGEPAQTIWFHPPYHTMIAYSGNMWGDKPHPDDLSNCRSVAEFEAKIQLALQNVYDALSAGGHYAVLIGNMRKNGEYIPLTDYVRALCPGVMKEEIIKCQWNTSSGRTSYSGSFVPIAHEKMYIFQRDKTIVGILDYAVAFTGKLERHSGMTWRNLLRRVMMKAGRPMTLTQIYESVEGSDKAKANPHWPEKVRQTLQDERFFSRQERGVYAINRSA